MLRRSLLSLFCLSLLAGCASTRPLPSQSPTTQVFRTVAGRDLPAYVFPAAHGGRRAPAVLLFHGGGWHLGEASWTFPAAERFAALGLVAIAVEYRLSEGEVTPIEALDDTCAAFAWAREHAAELGLDPNRVAGYGVSAGGQLVAAAAARGCGRTGGSLGHGGPDALVLWSPAVDVANSGWFTRLLQGRAVATDLSPAEQIRGAMPPVSIVQGELDTVTSLRGARRFCDQVTTAGGRCDLHVYPGVGHLLTRNLDHQEDNFDPDPQARADGIARHNRFLHGLWFGTRRGR